MIALLILVISLLTLLQFFVSYSRSLIVEAQQLELTEGTRTICGITGRTVAGDQFRRLVHLIDLCPNPGGESHKVRAIAAYFRMIEFIRIFLKWGMPSAIQWIDAERGGCAYAAAVLLDRRIAANRMMTLGQWNPQI